MNIKMIALAAALAAAPFAALAAPVTYTVTGTFTDTNQGGFSGTFVYDADTNLFSAINLSSTAGPGFAPATYNASILPNVPNAVRVTANGATPLGARCLVLALNGPMTNAAPTLTITQTWEGTAADAGCTSFSGWRPGAAGTVTPVVIPAPVPTMTEWAMILMGLLLAGGAAVMIQRRRPAA